MRPSEAGTLTPASVFAVYSNGRRKAGRPPKVHHWEIVCEICRDERGFPVNLRPTPFWHPKAELLAIAKRHNAEHHAALATGKCATEDCDVHGGTALRALRDARPKKGATN
jgi:hypothetical protein